MRRYKAIKRKNSNVKFLVNMIMKVFTNRSKFNIFAACLLALVVVFSYFSSYDKVSAEQTDASEKLYNTVIFLTFNEEGDAFPENFFADVFAMYETANVGVKNYFLKQSLNKLEVVTSLLYDSENCVRSDYPVEYYKPRYKWINGTYSDTNKGYYEEINEVGYDNRYFNLKGEAVAPKQSGAKSSIEGIYREQSLIREILSKVDLPIDFDGDYDKDGIIDSLVIITDVSTESDWGDVLWSHKSYVYEFSDNVVNGYYVGDGDLNKQTVQSIPKAVLGKFAVYSYNVIALNQLTDFQVGKYVDAVAEDEKELYNVGLLCHEMAHNLGIYDYYSYENSDYESVGEFDVMGTTNVVPQYMLAYNRQKLGWLTYDNLLYVNDSGDYVLKPASYGSGVLAVKIVLSNYLTTGEYFMAEFRYGNGAVSSNPFDGGLSGDGLIIYRINEANAYINSSGMQGSVNLGNMYGDDEIYVYRMGNGNSLNDPTGYTSYSLIGNFVPPLMTDFTKYDNTTFGNSNKNLTVDTLTTSKTQNSETIISYTDKSNSGIVFSNVKITDLGKISFHVELPEKQGTMPILTSKDVVISRFINGERRIYWNTNVKSGDAYILVLRSTERLKSLAEKGNSHIEFEDFQNGEFSYYKTLYATQLPIAEKYATIPEFSEEALVFIALQAENGNCSVRYVGCLQVENESFTQYIARVIDPLYVFIVLIVCFAVLVLITYIIMSKTGQYKRKK